MTFGLETYICDARLRLSTAEKRMRDVLERGRWVEILPHSAEP